ncbi:hypothetical protein [Mesorhizobium sp.]|nr:hypothetical protein [Mesorhizobium sp.]
MATQPKPSLDNFISLREAEELVMRDGKDDDDFQKEADLLVPRLIKMRW